MMHYMYMYMQFGYVSVNNTLLVDKHVGTYRQRKTIELARQLGYPGFFLFRLAYTNVHGWWICGVLVQFGCYQHRCEWGKGSVVL